ncbi:MAG TPA: hypothetical protein VHJ58_09050 [Vicinamibacterales bacterium]|nr:hypothetical protein [Vicinamibacterales bacterium]
MRARPGFRNRRIVDIGHADFHRIRRTRQRSITDDEFKSQRRAPVGTVGAVNVGLSGFERFRETEGPAT